MASPDTLREWLGTLQGSGATELRIRSGETSRSLVAVGVVRLPDDADPESAAGQVVDAVEGAGEGSSFRVLVYDHRGKQIGSRLFTPDRRTPTAESFATDPLTAAVVQMSQVVDRLCTSNERLVQGLAQPVTALAELFRRSADEADALRQEIEQQREDLTEMEIMARDAIDATTAGAAEPTPLQREVMQTLVAARGTFFGRGDGNTPETPPE